MDTIRSLLFLTEADLPKDGPVSVEDLVKFFPSKHKQAIEKLWGLDRLTYKGKQFFDEGSGFGPVYTGAMEAGKQAAKNETIEFQFDPSQTTNHDHRALIQDAEDSGKDIPSFEVDIKLDDMQEVYLGYQPSSGNLYIGFDAWADTVDDKIDEYLDGLDVDDDNIRDAIDSSIQLALKDFGFFGVLVELKSTDGVRFTANEVIVEPRGFYRGIHNSSAHGSSAFKHLKLIDLRLD